MSKRIGLQLYSLRDYVADDVPAMLKKVKESGFTAVEFAGYYGMEAEALRRLLDEIGLEPYSSHVGYQLLAEHLDEVAEYSTTLGLKYVICPHANMETAEDARRTAEVLNRAYEKLSPLGITVGYHNHAHEFVEADGRYLEDTLIESYASEEMVAQIDTCWARYAGVDPVAYIDSLGKQAGPVHFKELGPNFKPGSKEDMDVNIGEGIIDFAGVLKVMQKNGILDRGIIVEQEGFEGDPYEALARGVKHIESLWPEEA